MTGSRGSANSHKTAGSVSYTQRIGIDCLENQRLFGIGWRELCVVNETFDQVSKPNELRLVNLRFYALGGVLHE
jgi:hypothetical protein